MNDRAMLELLARPAQYCVGWVFADVHQLLRAPGAFGIAGQAADARAARFDRVPPGAPASRPDPRGGEGLEGLDFSPAAQRAGELVLSRHTLRDGCVRSEALAHSILDRVAAGHDVPRDTIRRALRTLGDV